MEKPYFFVKKTLTETIHQSISISLTVICLQVYRQLFLATLHNYTKKRLSKLVRQPHTLAESLTAKPERHNSIHNS
jgi:hypothetical protein